MLNNFFINELGDFYSTLTEQVSIEREKELKILLALSDILPESDNSSNFVYDSLMYLKENYGLNKSAWQALLLLHDELPDFLDTLSHLTQFTYNGLGYLCYDKINKIVPTNHLYPIDGSLSYRELRHYSLHKLFRLLSSLCAHFGVEMSVKYIGLFVWELDTKKSIYSLKNLYTQLNNNANLDRYQAMQFFHIFNGSYSLAPIIKRISRTYLYIVYDVNSYHYLKEDMKRIFIKENIEDGHHCDFFFDLIHTYQHYTGEKIINYDGLVTLNQSTILEKDKQYTDILLKDFDKAHLYCDNFNYVLIALVKLVSQYEHDFTKGFDKLNNFTDYINRSTEFREKITHHPKVSLDTLLKWSNAWHIKGESRGEYKSFKNYNIDLSIDNYYFEQIKDNYALHEEGLKQSHCVYIYSQDCLDENTIIISMKDSSGQRVSTLRFQRYKLNKFFKSSRWLFAENQKRFNRSCSDIEKKVSKEYFNLIKSKIN